MLLHLLKLTWNKKRQNFLISLEVFISFIVLFAVFTLIVYGLRNYNQPIGFNYEDTWTVKISASDNSPGFNTSDTVAHYHDVFDQVFKSSPDVTAYSFTTGFNTPFTMGHMLTNFDYKENTYNANNYMADDYYAKTLDLKMIEGRWFDKRDDGLAETPVVINLALKNKAFKNESALGKIITQGPNKQYKLKIIGVVNDFKDKGDYLSVGDNLFVRLSPDDQKRATLIFTRMKQGSDANTENRLRKSLAGVIKNADIQINHLTDQRKTKNKIVLIPLIIVLIMCSFLIVNVGLGLFGILWYNINMRRAEIGLRRAVGATGTGISFQLIGEALLMATLALLIGSFFAVQFPLLNVFDLPSDIYFIAIGLSIGFIYFLVILCALYPGSQAAKIYPAVTLHED